MTKEKLASPATAGTPTAPVTPISSPVITIAATNSGTSASTSTTASVTTGVVSTEAAAKVDISIPAVTAAPVGAKSTWWLFGGTSTATQSAGTVPPAAKDGAAADISGGYQEVVSTPSTGLATKEADPTAQATSTNFKDIFKTPEMQFVNGVLASKATIAPTLNYLSDKLKGGNTDKGFTDYYKEGVKASVSNVAKAGLFITTSVYNPMPAKYGITSKMAVNKLASDLIVNAAKLEFKELSKMCSIDYAKDFGLFLVSAGFSATGGKFLNIDKIFMENPFSMGAIMGSAAEIVDFAGSLAGSLVGFAGSLAGGSLPSPCQMMCYSNSTAEV